MHLVCLLESQTELNCENETCQFMTMWKNILRYWPAWTWTYSMNMIDYKHSQRCCNKNNGWISSSIVFFGCCCCFFKILNTIENALKIGLPTFRMEHCNCATENEKNMNVWTNIVQNGKCFYIIPIFFFETHIFIVAVRIEYKLVYVLKISSTGCIQCDIFSWIHSSNRYVWASFARWDDARSHFLFSRYIRHKCKF